jgi:hypothetical protein
LLVRCALPPAKNLYKPPVADLLDDFHEAKEVELGGIEPSVVTQV